MNPASTPIQNVYIHVPFCDGKCHYCSFYSVRRDEGRVRRYLRCLTAEMEEFAATRGLPEPTTLYVGGGTPSVLTPDELGQLCSCLRQRFQTDALMEWTVEINPGTVTTDKIDILRDAGTNRISVGAQSFHGPALTGAGRRHGVDDIANSVEIIRRAGIENIGLDLIAGLPGVDDDTWQRTLRSALALRPDHVSVYLLSVEAGSAWFGHVRVPNDDAQLRALDIAEETLADAELTHYEISNYARPGRECRHNLAFWRGGDYVGFGPAAASRIGRRRHTNRPDLDAYLAALESGGHPPRDEEELTPATDVAERLAFHMRLAEGVNLKSFSEVHAVDKPRTDAWQAKLQVLQAAGLCVLHRNRWQLTAKGRRMADYVAAELLP